MSKKENISPINKKTEIETDKKIETENKVNFLTEEEISQITGGAGSATCQYGYKANN